MIELPMRDMPRPPLLRGIGQGKESHDRRFDGSRDMHWSGIVSNSEIGSFDERAELGERQSSRQPQRHAPMLPLYCLKYPSNQLTLILGSCDNYISPKLLDQLIDHLNIQLPRVGTSW